LENFLLRDEGIKKVLIIGLGQLGLPVAKYVKEKGFDVYGYDISQKAIQRQSRMKDVLRVVPFINTNKKQ
jgi:UDP-N-acetyl-D-mannosaminuronate dehydrogenase